MLFLLRAVVQGTLEAVWERGKILFILSSLQLGQKLLSEGSNLKVWLVESLCEARPWYTTISDGEFGWGGSYVKR